MKTIGNSSVFLDMTSPELKVFYHNGYLQLFVRDNSEGLLGKIGYVYYTQGNTTIGIKNDGLRRKLYFGKGKLVVCDEAGNCESQEINGTFNATFIVTNSTLLNLSEGKNCTVTLSSAYEERTWMEEGENVVLPDYDDVYGIAVKCGNNIRYYNVQLDREKPTFVSYLALPSGSKWMLTWKFSDQSGLRYKVIKDGKIIYTGIKPLVYVEPGLYEIVATDEAGNVGKKEVLVG
jgi:hypothetical protein